MAYNFSDFKEEAKKIDEWLKKEYQGIHTGRATPAVLDNVKVEQYGSLQPIEHVASILVEGPKTLRVAPWDKGVLKDLEKAIRDSGLGLGVVPDAEGIRVTFPELTTEKRGILGKLVRSKLEEARVSLRKERERVWKDVEAQIKEGKLTEDDKFRAKDELQKLTDSANKMLDDRAKAKESEVMS